MVKTVVREHKNIETINSLYLDAEDSDGLIFWYDDVLVVIKEIKKGAKRKGKK